MQLYERVAVVTGAGGGLGRCHALELARRKALVVVNDLGSAVDGSGSSTSAAQAVVNEIRAEGGEAVADVHSVADSASAQEIIATALDTYGQVDILINNAGILRDKSFGSMTPEMIDGVLDVHLRGAMYVTAAAWPHMKAQQQGRVVCTSSAAGLYGNFGQANYSAAKLGLVGLIHTLAVEGERHGIKANAIAPVAQTRMTVDLLGKLADRLSPELVSPVVAWLAHDDCPVSGRTYLVGGGRIARAFIGATQGWTSPPDEFTVERLAAHLAEIEDLEGWTIPASLADDFRALGRALRAVGDSTAAG